MNKNSQIENSHYTAVYGDGTLIESGLVTDGNRALADAVSECFPTVENLVIKIDLGGVPEDKLDA